MKRFLLILPSAAAIVGYAHLAFGLVNEAAFYTPVGYPITSISTTMMVPKIPPISPTQNSKALIYIWPGLGPDYGNCYYPINDGVLQPVMTFGIGCPTIHPKNQYQWWISGQYVNSYLNCKKVPSAFSSVCQKFSAIPVCKDVGNYLLLAPQQLVHTSINYNAKTQTWNQTVSNGIGKKTYAIQLNYCSPTNDITAQVTRTPQDQNGAFLAVETYNYRPSITQQFQNTIIKIDISKNPAATCSTILTMEKLPSGTSCTPINTISSSSTNQTNVLTCQIASCTVYKPVTTQN